MKFSIVTTLYKSANHISEFYTRITASIKEITDNYEIIFVNDGSPDKSLAFAKLLQANDNKVTVIDLSRNFGHHRAIMTGLSYAAGDYVFLIDCDLEEPPELINNFWKAISTMEDVDVVYGVQQQRKGKFMEKYTGALFFNILNFLSDIQITKNLSVVRLMTKRYVKNLLAHRERELVFVGVAALTGYQQIPVTFEKKSRGTTSYTLKSRVNQAVNFITSLTSKPLVYIFYLGVAVTFFSSIGLLYLVLRRILLNIHLEGWASMIISIWFFGGIIIFCLGIIGIYLSKIFIEVKARPYSVIKNIYSATIKQSEVL